MTVDVGSHKKSLHGSNPNTPRPATPLSTFGKLDRHLQVDEARLQQRQRQLVFRIDPEAAVTWMRAFMKFQNGPPTRCTIWPKVDFSEEVMRFRTRAIFDVETVLPVALADCLVVALRPDHVLGPDLFDFTFALMRNALADEKFSPRRRGRRLVRPLAKRQVMTVFRAVVPEQGSRDLLWWCEQRAPCRAYEGARVRDERRRQQTSYPDQKPAS